MTVGVDLAGYALTVRKNPDGSRYLVASDVHSESWLREFKVDKEALFDGRNVRSTAQHKWYFAMLALVVEATAWPSTDALLGAIKRAAGHMELYEVFGGHTEHRPKSIAFSAMEGTKFKRWVRRSIHIIARETGIDGEVLMEETDQQQDGFYRKKFGSLK